MAESIEIVSDLSGTNSPDPKPETKPETKPDAKVSVSDTPKPETKPEVKVSESDTPKPDTAPKPEAKQPETKPEPKADAAVDDLMLAPKVPDIDLDSLDVEGLLKHAGLEGKQTEIAQHLLEKGDLPAETYAALKKIGIPKAIAKQFVKYEAEGASRLVVKYKAEAEAVAGGPEELENVRTWFTENTDKKELEQFDKMVRQDPSFYPRLIEIARARFEKANGPRSSNKPGFAGNNAVPEMPKGIAEQREILKRAAAGDVQAQRMVTAAWEKDKFKF